MGQKGHLGYTHYPRASDRWLLLMEPGLAVEVEYCLKTSYFRKMSISPVTSLARFREIEDRELCETSLLEFLKRGWQFIDPAPFIPGWHLEAIAEHLQAVTDGSIRRLIINVPPRTSKSSLCSVAWPAWTWAQTELGPCSGPQVQFLSASYAHTLSLRDSVKTRRLIQSSWYQKNWGSRFSLTGDVNTKGRFENSKGGYRLATSVDGTTTGEGGQIILVDDAMNASEVESDLVRTNTLQWWDEVMGSRLNDPATGAYVVIMQRLHQMDLTGHIITREQDDWVWLMLPMHHDAGRHCITYVDGEKFWEDPRKGEELLCEARFSEDAVQALAKRLGPFACTPAESPVLMGDLSLRPIAEVQIGDEIIGFSTDTNNAKSRRYLQKSKVLKTYQYFSKVVKITLSSGEVIRCTPDHKWYMGKQGGNRGWHKDGKQDLRPLYRSAVLGRKLMRVCPAVLPKLTPEQERSAGWVAGFFDGEGSVTNGYYRNRIRPNGEPYRPTSQISFHQTAEKNLPVCQRLERELESLGFSCDYTTRKNLPKPHWQERRHYRLTGMCLPTAQRFLYLIGPTRWRERILTGALGTKFIAAQEEVISIVPDGEEKVYALETETGNYVVWGLASSNSAGQLEQAPVPRGGGIIKEDWWQHWTERYLPSCEFVLASLDTAYTEKQENDASALTIWGIFRDAQGNPKVVLMYSWQDRLEFHDLVQKVVDSCTVDGRKVKVPPSQRFKVDRLLIESKAAGISVAQELHRTIGFSGQFGVELFNPTKLGDKVARTYAIQHLFSENLVYVPWPATKDGVKDDMGYKWVREMLDQVSVFPKGDHDDLVDSTTMALRWLREAGFLLRSEEHAFDVHESLLYRGRQIPLYPA